MLFKPESKDDATADTVAKPSFLSRVLRRMVSLKWDGISMTDMNLLDTFFTGLGGYRPFFYMPYGFSSTLKWTCADWGGTASTPWKFSAKLEQSFTLEV